MKNVFLCLCLFFCAKTFAFPFKIVKGDSTIKSEVRQAAGYTALASHGMMNVTISYGSSNTITVETDENILPYVETEVDNNALTIKVKDNAVLKPTNGIKIHITMTKIGTITQSGSGNITGAGNFSNNGKTIFNISGSGGINLEFATINSVEIKTSGSSHIKLKGAINGLLSVSQHGSGNVDCENAPCESVQANTSGSSYAKVNVSKSITAHISGDGHIVYKGNPTEIDKKISGSGSVSAM